MSTATHARRVLAAALIVATTTLGVDALAAQAAAGREAGVLAHEPRGTGSPTSHPTPAHATGRPSHAGNPHASPSPTETSSTSPSPTGEPSPTQTEGPAPTSGVEGLAAGESGCRDISDGHGTLEPGLLTFEMHLASASCSDVTYTLVVRAQDHRPLAVVPRPGDGTTVLVYTVDLSGYSGGCVGVEGVTSQGPVVFDVAPDPGPERLQTKAADVCVGQSPGQNFR